jgi:hypothetical protein
MPVCIIHLSFDDYLSAILSSTHSFMHLMCAHVSLFNSRMSSLSLFIFQFVSHLKDLVIPVIRAKDIIHNIASLI